MKSLLPIIIVVLALTGAITYSLAKKATQVKKDVNRFGISANKLEDSTTPKFKVNTLSVPSTTPSVTPTATVKAVATPSVTPTTTPAAELPTVNESTTTKGGVTVANTEKKITTVKTTVCTPVYGMANTCTEHVAVDTGAADSVFFNFAGLSYLGGLAAFIKAKTLKK